MLQSIRARLRGFRGISKNFIFGGQDGLIRKTAYERGNLVMDEVFTFHRENDRLKFSFLNIVHAPAEFITYTQLLCKAR